MEEIRPSTVARQRKMKRIARCFFVLSVLAILVPVIVGLVGYDTTLPTVLIAPALLVVGMIIRTRPDPTHARTSIHRE